MRITQSAFMSLCNNITNYHGNVANVGAYIARCIDNMLLAASVNIAVPSSSGKHRNAFNNFTQNTYDFDALEKKLLERG